MIDVRSFSSLVLPSTPQCSLRSPNTYPLLTHPPEQHDKNEPLKPETGSTGPGKGRGALSPHSAALYRGHIGIMEKKVETMMGLYRVEGLGLRIKHYECCSPS